MPSSACLPPTLLAPLSLHDALPIFSAFVRDDRQARGAGFVLEFALRELVLVVDGMLVAGGPTNDVAEFRAPVGPREAGHEPHEPDRERSERPFGGDVADQDPPPGVQVSLDLAEHADTSVRLRDVTVAEPGEGKHVKAPRKRDGLDRARVELCRETFLFEDATSQGDGARADVEALDAIPELEQRDQIAPRAAPDHENPILDLQKAIIQSALPGHQARADQLFAATELLPGVDDRSPQVLESQRSRSEMRQGAAGELESPGGAPEEGVRHRVPAVHVRCLSIRSHLDSRPWNEESDTRGARRGRGRGLMDASRPLGRCLSRGDARARFVLAQTATTVLQCAN